MSLFEECDLLELELEERNGGIGCERFGGLKRWLSSASMVWYLAVRELCVVFEIRRLGKS